MTQSLEQAEKAQENQKAKLINLLQAWIDEDDTEEQSETGNYLVQVLDDDLFI